MAETHTSTAFAATWRDDQGAIVGTTDGNAMCRRPRGPNILRLAHGDWTIIARCRECEGCIELDRRDLAQRLCARYPDRKRRLFLLRVYAPLSEHAALSHRLHRRRSLELEPGFFRLGLTSFGVIARSKERSPQINRGRGLTVRVEPIYLSRGRRAWRAITAGLTVIRSVYGEQVKRWYVRGLPPAEREKWEVIKLGKNSPYGRKTGPRVWAGERVVLVPPEAWRLPRASRRDIRALLLRAGTPESASAVMDLAGSLAGARRLQSSSRGAAEGRLSVEQVQEWYAQMARRKAEKSTTSPDLRSLPPLSEVGGYVSSGHSSGVPPPDPPRSDFERQLELDGRTRREQVARLKERPWEELTAAERALIHQSILEDVARAPEAARAQKDRAIKAVLDQIERFKKKVLGGE